MDNATMLRPAAAKQLAELLTEKQEPFVLEIYLLERGCAKTKCHSKAEFSCCCSGNTSSSLKKSNAISNCSKIAKTLFDNCLKARSPAESKDQNVSNVTGNQIDFLHRGYTATCRQELRTGNVRNRNEVVIGKRFGWKSVDDGQQNSPVSVLEEIKSEELSPVYMAQKNGTREEEAEIPNSMEFKDVVVNIVNDNKQPCMQYTKNNRMLQHTKQLLFECVMEVIENYGWKETIRRRRFLQVVGQEEIRNLFSENLRARSGEHQRDGSRKMLLVEAEAEEEWGVFEKQGREICMDIADAVLQDISSEIVRGMIKASFEPLNTSLS